METEKELPADELATINGGTWRDDVNGLIDSANGWLSDHHLPVQISHI